MDEDQRGEQTPQTDDGPESSPPIQKTEPHAIQDQGSTQDQDRKQFRWGLTQYERLSTIIQGCIFFTAFIYMIFAGLQWQTMNKALKLTDENITLTKQTVRAWLSISNIQRTSDIVPHSPITFNIKLKNIGPSTALDMSFEFADWICHDRPPRSCATECPAPRAREEQEGFTVVGPHGERVVEVEIAPQPPEVIDAIKNGTSTAYFCATVTYRDIFHHPHNLNVCAYYLPKPDNFAACPIGNSDH